MDSLLDSQRDSDSSKQDRKTRCWIRACSRGNLVWLPWLPGTSLLKPYEAIIYRGIAILKRLMLYGLAGAPGSRGGTSFLPSEPSDSFAIAFSKVAIRCSRSVVSMVLS